MSSKTVPDSPLMGTNKINLFVPLHPVAGSRPVTGASCTSRAWLTIRFQIVDAVTMIPVLTSDFYDYNVC